MSPPSKTHVMVKAKAYADALRDDPVMASQIREHLSPEQLIQLLGITENDILHIFRSAVVGDTEDEE
jgi:hypothetical protein